jgi:hypothetical protein
MPLVSCDQPIDAGHEMAMADFAFAPEHKELWKRVSRPGPVAARRWNEDRLQAFQKAVELRATWLYQRFYDDLNYQTWTSPEG